MAECGEFALAMDANTVNEKARRVGCVFMTCAGCRWPCDMRDVNPLASVLQLGAAPTASLLALESPAPGSAQRLDLPLEIAAIDEVHDFDAVGVQTEQQAVVATHALPVNVRDSLQPL